MKTILVVGAGRSSSSLINYLLKNASVHQWKVIVGDASAAMALSKTKSHPSSVALKFDIQSEEAGSMISSADVVISLLPPPFHPLVAVQCLKHKKHLLTASYVSDEMKAFDAEAKVSGLTFINECGLDPGIDHMSAMKVIDDIRSRGGKLRSFESFTGGLISPDTDMRNPWRYKFTWNPRNVVMAGQGTAKFIENGRFKYIPYQQLFRRTTLITVPGVGEYEGYANRDSLKYIETYQLPHIHTMLRGTLRNKGYCAAWNVFVQLGCCDDTFTLDDVDTMTHRSFLECFLPQKGGSVKEKLKAIPGLLTGNELDLLEWSGFFSDDLVGLDKGTPAQILEHILNKKWNLREEDKDQIVMWHRFGYDVDGRAKETQAALVATGNDAVDTAMAQTVGLPLAIACKLLLNGKITSRGVVVPTTRELYEPILAELETLGIALKEWEVA